MKSSVARETVKTNCTRLYKVRSLTSVYGKATLIMMTYTMVVMLTTIRELEPASSHSR